LKNESGVPGQVMVEVFTLPAPGTRSVSKGVVELGTIAPRGLAMVKVAEDVLAPLGIPTSYPTNEEAHFALEVVLTVPDATGVVQTFRKDMSSAWGMSLMNNVTSRLSAFAIRIPY
jgi:hypothetical protein